MKILNLVYLSLISVVLISTFIFKYNVIAIIILDIFALRFLSELIHEGTHYNFTNKKYNDAILNIFAFPYFFSGMSEHRKGHYKHHASNKFLVETDPDTNTSIIKDFKIKKLLTKFFIDISGVTALRIFLKRKANTNYSKYQSFWNIFYITTLFIVAHLRDNDKSILIFIIVILCIYPIFFRLRNYVQHFDFTTNNAYSTNVSNNSTGLIFKIFIASDIMRFHYLHHKYPGYDFRTLRAMYGSNIDQSNSLISFKSILNKVMS
jgi:fatty acid desaturase